MSAPAGGMLFLVSGAIAGTHEAAFLAAAFADSDAAQRGLRQAAVVGGKLEVRSRLPRGVACAEAKIFVELIRLDQFAGIHLPCRVPDALEFVEGFHQLRAKHFRDELGTRLSVAVFPLKRSPHPYHQSRRWLE